MGRTTPQVIKSKLESANQLDNKYALLYLHQQVFHMVKNFVLQASGNLEDAEDVFQDGLFILLKMGRQNKLPQDLNPEAYLFTICKNRWKKSLIKSGNRTLFLDNNADLPSDEDQIDALIENEKTAALQNVMLQLGENCRQLLLYYYYDRKKMKTIAQLMSYASEAVAKNKKAKCMKKLREIVFSSKSKKDLFLD